MVGIPGSAVIVDLPRARRQQMRGAVLPRRIGRNEAERAENAPATSPRRVRPFCRVKLALFGSWARTVNRSVAESRLVSAMAWRPKLLMGVCRRGRWSSPVRPLPLAALLKQPRRRPASEGRRVLQVPVEEADGKSVKLKCGLVRGRPEFSGLN